MWLHAACEASMFPSPHQWATLQRIILNHAQQPGVVIEAARCIYAVTVALMLHLHSESEGDKWRQATERLGSETSKRANIITTRTDDYQQSLVDEICSSACVRQCWLRALHLLPSPVEIVLPGVGSTPPHTRYAFYRTANALKHVVLALTGVCLIYAHFAIL